MILDGVRTWTISNRVVQEREREVVRRGNGGEDPLLLRALQSKDGPGVTSSSSNADSFVFYAAASPEDGTERLWRCLPHPIRRNAERGLVPLHRDSPAPSSPSPLASGL